MADRNVGTGSGGNATSYINLSLNFFGNEIGLITETFPRWVNLNAFHEVRIVNLAAGDNTISIPTWASSVVAVLPFNNNVNVTLKGAAADAGISIHRQGGIVLIFPPTPPASIVLNAASAINGVSVYFA